MCTPVQYMQTGLSKLQKLMAQIHERYIYCVTIIQVGKKYVINNKRHSKLNKLVLRKYECTH